MRAYGVWVVAVVSILALFGCSSPAIEERGDAATDSPLRQDAGDPPSDWIPPPRPDSGPSSTPCVQPPADDAGVSDNCFAYDLPFDCAPYECGRNVHYFCADKPNGDRQMPQADCHEIGTNFHGDTIHGYCCTAPTCARWTDGDTQCGGKKAYSCPVAGGDERPSATGCTRFVPPPRPDSGLAETQPWDRGDAIWCCQ